MRPVPNTIHLLAHRLGRPASTIHLRHDLVRDLDVTPLGRVLVALDVEQAENIDIDVGDLGDVRTVGELSAFLAAEVARGREAQVCLGAA